MHDSPADTPHAAGPAPFGGGATASERKYAAWIHISHAVVLLIGLPVIAPLILWLIRREDSEFIDDHGREAVNFDISLAIYGVALVILTIVTCGIGALGFIAWYVVAIVATVQGAVAASKGRFYRYPVCLRLIHDSGEPVAGPFASIRCASCGYELAGNTTGTCPECGTRSQTA